MKDNRQVSLSLAHKGRGIRGILLAGKAKERISWQWGRPDHLNQLVHRESTTKEINEQNIQVGSTLSQTTKALRESRSIALVYFRPLHQKGVRGQRHAPAAPYPPERPGTHYAGGWVGLRAGLDRCGKSRLTGIRSPDCPARRQSLYRLRYPAHGRRNLPFVIHISPPPVYGLVPLIVPFLPTKDPRVQQVGQPEPI